MIPRSLYRQKITYWIRTGRDGYSKPTFDAPVTVLGRWADKTGIVKTDATLEITFSTVVHCPVRLNVEDMVALGTSKAADPLTVDGARTVKASHSSPSVGGGYSIHTMYL